MPMRCKFGKMMEMQDDPIAIQLTFVYQPSRCAGYQWLWFGSVIADACANTGAHSRSCAL